MKCCQVQFPMATYPGAKILGSLCYVAGLTATLIWCSCCAATQYCGAKVKCDGHVVGSGQLLCQGGQSCLARECRLYFSEPFEV